MVNTTLKRQQLQSFAHWQLLVGVQRQVEASGRLADDRQQEVEGVVVVVVDRRPLQRVGAKQVDRRPDDGILIPLNTLVFPFHEFCAHINLIVTVIKMVPNKNTKAALPCGISIM